MTNSRNLKLVCSHFHKKQSLKIEDIENSSVKKLKQLCSQRKIDISDCLEKTDIIIKIVQICRRRGDITDDPEPDEPTPCIVYLHGNCGCRMDAVDCVEMLLLYGFSVFCVDLSGSGHSEGNFCGCYFLFCEFIFI